MNRKSWIGARLTLAVAFILVLFPGCSPGSETQPDSEVVVGGISPLTGEGANYGMAARTGVELALEEINQDGGINGSTLVVKWEDDKGNPTDALSAFQKLVSFDRVPAILGPFYSGNVLAVAPVANENRVVVLSGSATSDNIRDAGDFVFRVCPSNDEQARTIADFAFRNLGLRTSAIIYRNVDYGVTLRDRFREAFTSLGGTILAEQAVPADARDVRAQLTQVANAAPDFVFAAVHYPEGGTLLRQARELGLNSTIIGTDGGYDPQLIEIAGDAAEGSYWATIGWGQTEANSPASEFQIKYQERFGQLPGVYSGLYYDAAHVLGEALKATAGGGPGSLREALMGVSYTGPTGLTTFDSRGDVAKPFSMYRVSAGAFVPVIETATTAPSGM